MELKYLRTELHRLTALVEGWTGTDEIPALERDLALEKLRSLYEMLRFDAVQHCRRWSTRKSRTR